MLRERKLFMASYHLMFILPILIAAASVATLSFVKEFIVGDEQGWDVGVDYHAWAKGKDFRVGDKLVFQYPAGDHNVYRLKKGDFLNCTVPVDKKPAGESGNDTIVLAYPGKKWYICGVGTHCSLGQKLVIPVKLSEVQPPVPSIAPDVQPPFPSIAPSPYW